MARRATRSDPPPRSCAARPWSTRRAGLATACGARCGASAITSGNARRDRGSPCPRSRARARPRHHGRHPGELAAATTHLYALRLRLIADGLLVRAAAFTSVAPGIDMARSTREHDVDLLLVDAPGGPARGRARARSPRRPRATSASSSGTEPRAGPVLVPFTGAEHDWAAVELGAWLARPLGLALPARRARRPEPRAATPAGCSPARRSPSSARLALPPSRCSSTGPGSARRAADGGRQIAVVGLTDRWRHEGLGRTMTARASDRCATDPGASRGAARRPRACATASQIHLDRRGLTELSPPSSGAGGARRPAERPRAEAWSP